MGYEKNFVFVCLFVCLGAFAEETKLKPSISYDIGFGYTCHGPTKYSDVDNNLTEHIFKLPVNFIASFSNENRELFSIKLGFDIGFDGFYGYWETNRTKVSYYFDKAPSGLLLGFNLVDVEINLNKTVGIELNLVHLNYNYTTQKTYCDSNFNLFLNCSDKFRLRAGLNVYYEKTINNKLGFNVGFTFRNTNKNNTKVETENEIKGLSCKEHSNGTISFYYNGYDILIQRETGELINIFPKEERERYLNFISSKIDTTKLSVFNGNKIGYIINGYCVY